MCYLFRPKADRCDGPDEPTQDFSVLTPVKTQTVLQYDTETDKEGI